MKTHSEFIRPRIRVIQQTVADFFKLPVEMMRARDRTADVSMARHIAMVLSRRLTRNSLQVIGAAFARDHGTITHAVNAVRAQVDTDPDYRAEYIACEQRVLEALVKLDPPKVRSA